MDRPLELREVETLRISRQTAREIKVVSHTHQPPLPPRRYPWYSFLLEVHSTDKNIKSMKKNPKDLIGNWTRDLSSSSAGPHSTSSPGTPHATPSYKNFQINQESVDAYTLIFYNHFPVLFVCKRADIAKKATSRTKKHLFLEWQVYKKIMSVHFTYSRNCVQFLYPKCFYQIRAPVTGCSLIPTKLYSL